MFTSPVICSSTSALLSPSNFHYVQPYTQARGESEGRRKRRVPSFISHTQWPSSTCKPTIRNTVTYKIAAVKDLDPALTATLQNALSTFYQHFRRRKRGTGHLLFRLCSVQESRKESLLRSRVGTRQQLNLLSPLHSLLFVDSKVTSQPLFVLMFADLLHRVKIFQ